MVHQSKDIPKAGMIALPSELLGLSTEQLLLEPVKEDAVGIENNAVMQSKHVH